jgi:hypothetical protein
MYAAENVCDGRNPVCDIIRGACVAPDWNNTANGLPAPTDCDNNVVFSIYPAPICPGHNTCNSPIILDLNGHGFVLTNATNGVLFDISGTSQPVQMGWIAQGADNAFLTLPGPDGLVHSGKELFGNFTPQPASDHPNGFAALAVYDDPKNGGNGDGIIDSRDAIFSSLRLWIDQNHDGISQPGELHTLVSLGVNSISLRYQLLERTDQYGNVFRYKSKVNPDDTDASHVARTAYDVFFVALDSTARNIVPRIPACPVPATTGDVKKPLDGGILQSGKR